MSTKRKGTGTPPKGPGKEISDAPAGKAGPRSGTRPSPTGGGEPRRIETRAIALLRPHPRQDDLFRPLPHPELQRLADSMRRHGQDVPVEITPANETIGGHQRVRAARLLGWEQIQVWVRDDLGDDEAAIELRMIEANRVRRQLDMLDMVRLARRELEIRKRKQPGGLSPYEGQDLRDQVGEMVGRSGRQVQRYLNILDAPMEVQRAYSEGKVTGQQAEKVARLEADVREEIAEEIRAGGDPAEVVAAHLPEAAPAEVDPDREYQRFLEAATHAVAVLDGRVERVRGGMDLAPEIEVLKEAGTLIDRLIARHRALQKQRDKTTREFANINNPRGS